MAKVQSADYENFFYKNKLWPSIELTELEVRVGPLSLYIDDAYTKTLAELFHLAIPATASCDVAQKLAEERSLQSPLRLRTLHIHPLDLTLTLHTAVSI